MFRIYEQAEGYPDLGEKVYSPVDNMVYIVTGIGRDILTLQWKSNYLLASLEVFCSPADLGEEEFNNLRNLKIEEVENEQDR